MNEREEKKDKDGRPALPKRAAAALLALAVWQVLSVCVHQSILLPSPWQVFCRFWEICREPDFIRTAVFSLGHVWAGFLAGLAGGILLGGAAAGHRSMEIFLQPWIQAAKTVPVAAVVVIMLIWLSARRLSVLIAALVVLPVVYQNVLTGCRETDRKMAEMARIFRLSLPDRFRMVLWPALEPYLRSAVRVSAGMAWKAGIAAEILGTPAGSVGRRMYLAKTVLDTEALLAWTVTAVAMSILSEKLAVRLLDLTDAAVMRERNVRHPKRKKSAAETIRDPGSGPGSAVILSGVGKAYGDKRVLRDLSVTFPAGRVSVIRGPSGAGKTTLLRLIMGLEEPDAGTITGAPPRIGAVFQEDRLCERMTAAGNVLAGAAAGIGRVQAEEHLRRAGLGDSLRQPVSAFSAGMKRRTAIVRACLSDGDILILDEPFAGLDPDMKEQMTDYIREQAGGRTVLLVTHQEDEEAKKWKGFVLRLTGN